MATGDLSPRKGAILTALVEQYIRSGEPVGSEAVAAASALGVSSATIRHELAALEEMGYLTQPHTSAGRAPTDLAYRYYVNLLPPTPRLRSAERRAIVHFFDEALANVDEMLRGTTQLLSRLTRYASLALAPSPTETKIARAELVNLGTATLMLVVFETGQIEKRQLELAGVSDEEIEDVSRTVIEAFRGRTLNAARGTARERAKAATGGDRTILDRVAEALESIGQAGETTHIFLGGVANIAAEEAFERRETLRRIYQALERESAILRLLRQAALAPPVSVMIGHENPLPEMWEASVVAAPFVAGGGATGTIGVIGPTRMDYLAAISAVREVAKRLSAAGDAAAP
ncbi:MAG TPA: heat-inducible transcriptional repressor HrcA [Actinomycetota bacterium]|nr:heat-inducible transcriptional repressor HrcA [Actinomycetota bacterium]